MSVSEVLSRISEIQAQIQQLAPPQPAGPGFASALGQQLNGNTSTSGSGGLGAPTKYDGMILESAKKWGVPPALVKAMMRQESGFNPNAGSPAGAQGLMQLMPATAAGLGCTNPFDPAQNINAGAHYLKDQLDRFHGNVELAVAAYNAGPNAVAQYGGIPPYPETQNYVKKVMGYVQEYGGLTAGTAAAIGGASSLPIGPNGTPTASAASALAAYGSASGASPVAKAALREALSHIGTPYKWGGESPSTGFDCSGLMQYSYGKLGVSIPRTSEEQFRSGTPVDRAHLRPGDLVFFSDGHDVHHVGMYVGGGKFVEAPHTGDVVKIASLSEPYYASQYCGARRYA